MEKNEQTVTGDILAPTSMAENAVLAVFLTFGRRSRPQFPKTLFVRRINEAGLLKISAT